MFSLLTRLFGAAAAAMLLVGCGLAIWSGLFLARSERADGVVVRLDDAGPIDRRPGRAHMFRPVVRFVAASGETVEFSLDVAAFPPPYAIGDPVEVRYARDAPSNAHVASLLDLWFRPILITFMGGVFAIVATVVGGIGRGLAARRADLVANGVTLDGQVVAVETSYFTKSGGRPMCRVVAAAKDETGALRRFQGGLERASRVQHLRPGDKVQIIVDRRDPNRFSVEIPAPRSA